MTEQLEHIQVGLPSPHDHAFMAFSRDTREEDAALAFRRRYGQHPEFVVESLGNLLCGPIPDPDEVSG